MTTVAKREATAIRSMLGEEVKIARTVAKREATAIRSLGDQSLRLATTVAKREATAIRSRSLIVAGSIITVAKREATARLEAQTFLNCPDLLLSRSATGTSSFPLSTAST